MTIERQYTDPVLADVFDLAAFGPPAATLISVAGLTRPDRSIEVEAVAAVD